MAVILRDSFTEKLELPNEARKVAQGNLVWAIGKGAGGIFVGFEKHTIASGGDGCAGQNGCEFPIA